MCLFKYIIIGLTFFIYASPLAAKIPSVIHTCQFDESIDMAVRFQNWKKAMPEYTIKVWDKSNFNLQENEFLKKASALNRYDQLSAYCAFKVLNEEGGIYLSPYQALNKDFSEDVQKGAFLSFLHSKIIAPSIIALPAHHRLSEKMLAYYRTDKKALGFVPPNYALTGIFYSVYPYLQKNGKQQSFEEEITLYPANKYILNLGDSTNKANYRFDLVPEQFKTAEMSFETLKKIFLKEQAVRVSHQGKILHIYPVDGLTFYIYELKKTSSYSYVDENVAAFKVERTLDLFVNENGTYVYQNTYRLARKPNYGNAVEIEAQGNPTVKKEKE